MRHIR